jgi:nucleotide-binding universal stress UspA family protein
MGIRSSRLPVSGFNHRIIVPINGYPPNERSIPVADALAKQFGGDVELISMVFHENYHSERSHLLHRLAERVHSCAFTTTDSGSDPAAFVLDRINQPDSLVVLSGGTTVAGIPGSMTVDVLRFASRPFVMVGPKTDSFWAGPIERIVVLLDGSPAAEASLAVATTWATQLNAQIELLQVISPDDVRQAKIFAPDSSEVSYLDSVSDSVQVNAGLPVDYEILHAAPHDRARAMTHYVGRSPRTIFCMASNGFHQSGSMVGGTTLEVIHESSVPVLLVRS